MHIGTLISTPNSRMTWERISPCTGQHEKSIVIYDQGGRMIYRVDLSTHMRPVNHSNPHLHMFEFGPGFNPVKGKETVFNFFNK